jgi:hypothetical protein
MPCCRLSSSSPLPALTIIRSTAFTILRLAGNTTTVCSSCKLPGADPWRRTLFTLEFEQFLGRWDLVQLRCANFVSCRLEERLALTLLELAENFGSKDKRGIRLTVVARHKDLTWWQRHGRG